MDVRHAFQMLTKNPGVTIAAIVVLALGIGAYTAIFSVVNAPLLKPLAYPNADRVADFCFPPAALPIPLRGKALGSEGVRLSPHPPDRSCST